MMYCWREGNSECSEGPFSTIEQARADVLSHYHPDLEPDRKIEIAEVLFISPRDWIWGLSIEVLERMDENLDEEVSFDEPVFEIPEAKRNEAEEALDTLLGEWASKYVEAGGKFQSGKVIEATTVGTLRKP